MNAMGESSKEAGGQEGKAKALPDNKQRFSYRLPDLDSNQEPTG